MHPPVFKFIFTVFTLFLSFSLTVIAAPPASFSKAKAVLKDQVYFDQNINGALGTIYCGCDWEWVGSSGGRIHSSRCGYEVRAIPTRGARTEVEHVFAASHFGQQRQCWQNGGRTNCNKTDPVFNLMESNLHNLSFSVGELNADRSNYQFGELPDTPKQHGRCESTVDFKQRIFSPRPEVRGKVARIHFYMADRYDLRLSDQQQKLFMAWNKMYPVTQWEQERDRRITSVMGHHNEFVTGKRAWGLGHRNSREGVVSVSKQVEQKSNNNSKSTSENDINGAAIHGNRNSKIYHPKGCHSYNAMSKRHIVNFSSETEAVKAGYRRAKNCK